MEARKAPAFGGVQVVFTGDFCQLPPVKPFQHCITCGQEMTMDEREVEFDCPDNHGPFREHEKWAFMSDAWDECTLTRAPERNPSTNRPGLHQDAPEMPLWHSVLAKRDADADGSSLQRI